MDRGRTEGLKDGIPRGEFGRVGRIGKTGFETEAWRGRRIVRVSVRMVDSNIYL